MASRKARRRAARQAADEAFIRYNPERSTLVGMLDELKGERDSSVAAAKTGARLISRSAKRAAGPLDRIYGDAASRSSAVQAIIDKDLGKLGPAAAGLVAAANSGLASTGQGLQGARTRAAEEMAARRVDAVASGRQEARNARATYRGERAKVLDRLVQNEREAGTYASGRVGALLGEQADRGVRRRQIRTTSRDRAADRASRERIASERTNQAKQKERAKVRSERKETRQKISVAADRYLDLSKATVQDKGEDGKLGPKRAPTETEVRARMKSEGFSAVEITKAIEQLRRQRKLPGTSSGGGGGPMGTGRT